jgi:hypothetical protein
MSWESERDDTPAHYPVAHRKPPRWPLTIRLSIAAILAVALAVGTSYTLRTLNL